MAARKRLRLAQKTRERIRTSMLINRLQYHALGKCDMTLTQVKAALTVLRKTWPDLKSIKVEHEEASSYIDASLANYHYNHKSRSGEAAY